uniref:DUF223 domain-containing protein n=1 Tax=Oryza punctata TaxID=4537 RepID=A0A0E0KD41_ORYPU
MDATDSKMEAIVSGENAARFKNILIVGQKYTIHGVYFKPNSWEINFRAIKMDYDCFFTRTTIVESYNLPLQFPLYPKQLTKFSDLSQPEHRNKTFVTLLDTRCDLVVIGVYANHLTTHVLQWASAIAKNHVVVGTMLQLDRTYCMFIRESLATFVCSGYRCANAHSAAAYADLFTHFLMVLGVFGS